MKRTLLLLLLFINTYTFAQITYISPFTGNQGGVTLLFGQHVPNGSSNMFLNWECFGSGTTGPGQGSQCRVIVRAMAASADPESVIASNPVCSPPGTYLGENGNNDTYFVNLNVCNLPPGRYSVEIQCDELGEDFDNSTGGATAATTWNYWSPESPTAYYLGTSGSCGQGDGLDNITEVGEGGVSGTPQIEYFNIGNADVYRSMVIINNLFLDMGKFQPGNPTLPASLNDLQTLYDPACAGVGTFPVAGFCGTDGLTLNGAEVNITKWDCGDGFGTGNDADVTANRLYWRVYLSTATAPSFRSVNIGFNDDCPTGYPSNTIFTAGDPGGSCQNLNGILDQRWQTTNADIDLLAMAPVAGTYILDFYTETDIVDCSGAPSTVREPASGEYSTQFTRLDHLNDCGGTSTCVTAVGSYEFSDMVTIFSNNGCTGCHGASGGLNLSNYNNVINGGNNGSGGCGPYATPLDFLIGKVDGTLLAGDGCGSAMPNGIAYGKNGLTAFEIAAIKSWVDAGAPNSCPPVPVELTDFQAHKVGKRVSIEWQTASEENSDYFVVERSRNGYDFEEVATEVAAGYSVTTIDYQLWDLSPFRGNNYYRLKMLDKDGSMAYSKVKEVTFGDSQSLFAYPTISSTEITLEWADALTQEGRVLLYDCLGKIILDIPLPAQSTKTIINVADLPHGTYFVRLVGGQEDLVTKIVKGR